MRQSTVTIRLGDTELSSRFKLWLNWLFGALGIVGMAVTGWELLQKFVFGEPNLAASHLFILFLVFLVIVACAIRVYQTIRKEKYANAARHLHQCIHGARDLQSYLVMERPADGATKEELLRYSATTKMLMTKILDQVSEMFSSLTGTNCRACVKLSYPLAGEGSSTALYFYTYARNESARTRTINIDSWRLKENHDPHSGNPDLAKICDDKNANWHFFCNDLTQLAKYSSTSISAYNSEIATSTQAQNFFQRLAGGKWHLPYKAIICCAIRQGSIDAISETRGQVPGYLGIDSESRGVFVERWDSELLYAVADALYHPVQLILQAQHRLNQVN